MAKSKRQVVHCPGYKASGARCDGLIRTNREKSQLCNRCRRIFSPAEVEFLRTTLTTPKPVAIRRPIVRRIPHISEVLPGWESLVKRVITP